MVKYIVAGLVLSCLFFAVTVQAQQDPTAPLGWQKKTSPAIISIPRLPQLQSVICDNHRCRATLNGHTVTVGSHIKGYRVSQINDSSVILTRNQKQWQLSLFTANIKQ
ncbi:MSHA biogenesis protein MshK [Photobacterium phosphoreum]|uniref:MSHA biogenesis protein MshK n=1 Tax=Photobacterium phosphoreum TaxID=659 RepID=UPI001EFDE6A2|nr:MSHA biogenesis protein MshK [Photobacterium phosphoreum]